jgi:hypothetical protein
MAWRSTAHAAATTGWDQHTQPTESAYQRRKGRRQLRISCILLLKVFSNSLCTYAKDINIWQRRLKFEPRGKNVLRWTWHDITGVCNPSRSCSLLSLTPLFISLDWCSASQQTLDPPSTMLIFEHLLLDSIQILYGVNRIMFFST